MGEEHIHGTLRTAICQGLHSESASVDIAFLCGGNEVRIDSGPRRTSERILGGIGEIFVFATRKPQQTSGGIHAPQFAQGTHNRNAFL